MGVSKKDENPYARLADDVYMQDELQELHQAYYLQELQYLKLIYEGNTTSLERLMAMPPDAKYNFTKEFSPRFAKDIFVGCCALYSRAAIAGGMNVTAAFRMNDEFIRRCEDCGTSEEVYDLLAHVPMEYAGAVERDVKYKDVSQPIMTAIHYIQENLNKPLSASVVAKRVELSTSYFLKRFKEETGSGFSDFVAKCRIMEACLLLKHSDMSLAEISNYFCFSSQSYFQNVFKREIGLTPGQYRRQRVTTTLTDRVKDKIGKSIDRQQERGIDG